MAASQGASFGLQSAVESSKPLDAGAQRRLEQNLSLARELGAEVVVTHDTDVADALVRVALQNNATQIVVGKSRNPAPIRFAARGEPRRPSPADRRGHRHLRRSRRTRRRKAVDMDRLAPDGGVPGPGIPGGVRRPRRLLTAMSWFVVPHSGYLSVGLFFLLAVIVLSLRVGPGPVLVAGVASALTWDFLFIPPIFTFAIARFEDGLMFVTYFVVAVISGQLTARVRAQARNERIREDRATPPSSTSPRP